MSAGAKTTSRFSQAAERLSRMRRDQWAIHAEGRARAAKGADIIELTIGEPDAPADAGLIDAAAAALRAGRTRYTDGAGEPTLRRALGKFYRRRRADVGPDNALCFPGAQTALYATIATLAGEGAGVLTPDPYYATYQAVVAAAGARLQPIALSPAQGFRLDAAALEAAATSASRVLLISNPHNPSGAVMTPEDVDAIAAAARRLDLWVVCDEVYEALIFDGALVSPFDRAESADRVIAISSISKTFAAPGLRVGWAVGPRDFVDHALPLSEAMLFGGQPFMGQAAAAALLGGRETAEAMRRNFRARAERAMAIFADAPGLVAYAPAAGMFMLVEVRGLGLDGEAFARSLLDGVGVSVMPGSAFGDAAAGCVRLSLTASDRAFDEACRRIVDHAATLSAPLP